MRATRNRLYGVTRIGGSNPSSSAIHKSPRKRGDLCMENKKWGLNPSDDSLLMSEQAIAKRMNVINGTQEFLFIS